MNARVRVLPPISKRGPFVLCVGLGLAHGIIGAWVCVLLLDRLFGMSGPTSTFGFIRVGLAVAAAFLITALPAAMLIFRVHPRMGRLLACGAMYGASCFAGVFAVISTKNPEMQLAMLEPEGQEVFGALLSLAFGVAVGFSVFAAAYLGMFALGSVIERMFGKRVIQQTGLICWVCGYNLGSSAITVCPECGQAFDLAARPRAASPRILSQFVLGRWVLLVLALLVALMPVAYVTSVHTIPSMRFLRACPAGASLQQTGMMGNYTYRRNSSGGFDFTLMPISHGWWIPDAKSPDTGFTVQFVPRADGSDTSMFVSRAALVDMSVPAGAVIAGPIPKYKLAAPGTTRVTACLSREQAESVIASRAIPAGLKEALRLKAEQALWKTADPMATPAMAAQKVDAAPFFPGMAPAAPVDPGW